MNTSILAEKLGVSPKTVHRWIKHFNMDCQKNEHGHYIFDENDYASFVEILEGLRMGMSVTELKTKASRKGRLTIQNKEQQALPDSLQQQLTSLAERIENNERKIDQKANEVVSYQLLQHRKEIDELQKKVMTLEKYVQALEEEKRTTDQARKEIADMEKKQFVKKGKKKKVMSFLF